MYYQGYQNDPWRGPTTLPLIVCRELRDEISYVVKLETHQSYAYNQRYQDVCKALGCARLYFETNRDLYANTRYDYRDSFMSDPGSAGPHKIGNLPPISTLLNFNPSLCAPMSSSAMPLRFDGLTAMPSRPSTSVSLTRAPLAGQKRRLDSGISDDIDGVSQLRHMGDEGVFGRDEGVSAGPRPCLYGWKRGPRSRRSRKMRSA